MRTAQEHIVMLKLKPIDAVKVQKLVAAATAGISSTPLGVSAGGV